MKNRFVIVEKSHSEKDHSKIVKTEPDEVFLKKTEALTFEGAYGELTSSGAGDWAPVKAEIQKKKASKNPA